MFFFFNVLVENVLEKEVWDLLREVVVIYCGELVGIIVVKDLIDFNFLNYD